MGPTGQPQKSKEQGKKGETIQGGKVLMGKVVGFQAWKFGYKVEKIILFRKCCKFQNTLTLIPKACPAIPIRPPSKVSMAILNPIPGVPSKFSLGITQSSIMTLEVDEALIPSLSSFLPRDTPGALLGTIKALIPRML